MRSAALALDGYKNADDDASMLTDASGQKRYGNSHNGNNTNKNVNINETTLWSKTHDMQASSASANPVLRNINNDMTKSISRKPHQLKMQFTASDRDGKLGNDDLRVTKIMRRLNNETNPAAALELCAKLEMVVRTPNNVGYLKRSFVVILDGMLSLFKQCSPPVLEECSKTLGFIGYINRMSYPIYEEFIMKNYRAYKRMQKYLITALRTTLSCDTKCDLHIYSAKIILMLKDFLEGAENPDIFMAISTCIVQFSNSYRDAFECHFTDVVDIIIGWQLETGQPKQLRSHCAYVLEQLTPYFSKQLDFSYGLLTQFIEDITALDMSERPGERIGAFVGAFNSLLKCLTCMHITCESIVSVALTHLIKMLPVLLNQQESSEDALININELLCICLLNGYTEPDAVTLDQVIHLQFEHISHWPEPQQLSCLYLLLCSVRKLRARLPASLVELIFQTDAAHQSFLVNLRLHNETVAHNLLLRTCQETLLIKNVPLLQQAYKHLVQDVDDCVQCLVQRQQRDESEQTLPDVSHEEANVLLIFHLTALAALAKQTSSIIGMYACKPSILELLITNCRTTELDLWSKHPATYHAILSLIVFHCQANHNFRKSSSLLREDDNESSVSSSTTTSPTAHSFGQILKFLAHCLPHAAQLAQVNLEQLLVWTKSLLTECRSKADILLQHKDFVTICESLANVVVKYAPLEAAYCIQGLLDYGTANLPSDLLQLYRETSLQQLQLQKSSSQAVYAQIYAQLPLRLTISRRMNAGIGSTPICVWLQRLGTCTAVRDNVFREFFEGIQSADQGPLSDNLRCLFLRSCQVTVLDERQEKLAQCARRCQRLANAWLQFEAARYCVDQKLRTTLGKPQDTFLAFEAIILRFARLLTGCVKDSERQAFDGMSLQQLSNMRSNLCMLLGFLDALEKLIFNAAEGTAYALRPPEKPVSAFFRLNNPTCQSWFNRIRISVVIIAKHCHQPELVIRYAEQILMSQKPQDCTYSQAIVYLAWAFISCRESESLRGLHVWARSKTDKCCKWLQHAAEQAAGRKELAIAGYRSILAEESQIELEPHTRQFLLAQLSECLQSTGQWSHIVELKAQLKRSGDINQFNSFQQKTNTEMTMLEQLLAKSEIISDDLTEALHSLTIWPSEKEEHASFSMSYVSEKLENIVLQQALDDHSPFKLDSSMQRVIDMNWRDSLLNYSYDQRHWQHLTLLKHVVQRLSAPEQEPLSLLPLQQQTHPHNQHCPSDMDSVNSSILMKCVTWTQLLRNRCSVDSLAALYLDTAMVARTEGNQLTCQKMLELFFGQPLMHVAGQLVNQPLVPDNLQLLRGYSELVKYLHLQQQPLQQQHPLQCNELSSINVCTALCLAIQKQPMQKTDVVSHMGAELLLTLSDWIATRSCCGLTINKCAHMQELLQLLPECPLRRGSEPHGERLVARLLNASLQLRPHNEEALIAYGNWCYRWGKKIVDSGSVLSSADVDAIGEALGDQQPLEGEPLQELLEALRMEPQPGNNCEEDELQTDSQCEIRLRRLSLLANKPAEVLESIVRIWRHAIANTFNYYKEAARSYFLYLSVKAGTGQDAVVQPSHQRFQVHDSNMVTTTLRLLRLIVKHASGLQDVLEQGLTTTPIGPWKLIIPQLFSRLNHHEPYVRKSVCALLCRLAESRPQLVIFPAVVGANRELQATPVGDGDPADAAAPGTSSSPPTSSSSSSSSNNNTSDSSPNSYTTLLGALTKQSPEVVLHVQLLVKELRRVCLLWDEYWIHSLACIYNTYVGRISSLSSEFKPDDLEGKQNRFNTWRPQMLNDLEALMAFTSREPETSYERNFMRRFEEPIESTLDALRNLPYPGAWDKLKNLYHVLQANMLRGTSSTLKMQVISPVLCEIGRMRISMPGLDAHDGQQPVYIQSVDSTVYILPTKTKPKKVAFYGCNGQKYTFLFKGMEDLHLDERIMQFLSISNAIMANRTDTPHSCYRAHHYSVIPLGPQSGLISWVDGVTPLFALYKKWQQRHLQPATFASTRHLTDVFYNKLTPLLAKYDMLVTDSRRQWPLPVLRQVFAELQQETPSDLLSRELWCHAGSAAEWRQSVRRYTSCMAVMSVIGYVIGLGDRHLDNVLVNLSSGDIVHIDYNVCFEKGRTLRIPERVPFRLTQNMVHALGITGIEGAFRLGCEYVLKVMRKERETLLTLLEAFVYDPLVDWTVNEDALALRRGINVKPPAFASNGAEHKLHKKDKAKFKLQDWDAKRSHYVGKLKQCKNYWVKYKLDMLPQMKEMLREIEQLQQILRQRQATEQELLKLNQRSALVAEINSLGTAIASHSFNTASPRYADKLCHTETLARQAKLCRSDYEMVHSLLASYGLCLDPQRMVDVSVRLQKFKLGGSSWHIEYVSLLELVKYHLPTQAMQHYDSVRTQHDELFERLIDLGMQCLDHMQQYAAIMAYYPEQRRRENIYVRFHDSFASYLNNGDSSNSPRSSSSTSSTSSRSNSLSETEAAKRLSTFKTMEAVWLDLNCQLHMLTQQFASKQAHAQTQTPSHSLLMALTRMDCSQSQLNAALMCSLEKANSVFSEFERSAVEAQDSNLTQHQLQHIQLVCFICKSTLLGPVEQTNNQLNHLNQGLAALLQLQQCFEQDLAASLIRLLLSCSNQQQVEALQQLRCEQLAQRYGQLFPPQEQDQSQPQPQPQMLPQLESSVQHKEPTLQQLGIPPALELQFLQSLQPAYEQFQQMVKALESVSRSIQLCIDDVHDGPAEQYMELSILTHAINQLSDNSFFELVLQTLNASSNCDLRLMSVPIKSFVQRLQQQYIVGLVPLICQAYYTNCICLRGQELPATANNSAGDPNAETIMVQLCDRLLAALQLEVTLQQQQCDITLLQRRIKMQTLVATAHFWAYGESLDSELNSAGHIINRQKLCDAISQNCQAMSESALVLQRLQQVLLSEVEHLQNQRNSWNRNHIDCLLRNEQQQNQLTTDELDVINELTKCANALCAVEQMLAVPGGQQQLLDKMEQWLQAYTQWQVSNARISGVEQSIVQLLDPQGAIDQSWVENVQSLLEEYTCKVQRDLFALESEQQNRYRYICTLLKDMQRHHDQMPRIYIRNLCTESEDQSKQIPLDVQLLCGHVRDTQRMLLNFFQQLVELRKDMTGERHGLPLEKLASWQRQLQHIEHLANNEMDEFFKGIDRFLQHAAEAESLPYETFTLNKGGANLHEQKRNAYGVSVWKKIRMKLEGRDPDSCQRATVAEQVDYIISEAINPDNLAVLYEGWTPWI